MILGNDNRSLFLEALRDVHRDRPNLGWTAYGDGSTVTVQLSSQNHCWGHQWHLAEIDLLQEMPWNRQHPFERVLRDGAQSLSEAELARGREA